tara:strand:- start:81 stop:332 length:252 start_codon:yes stop_codon:yes gene_type:complete
MKIIDQFIILIIKFYKFFISPFFVSSCRYQPTCSEYFIDSVKLNGSLRGVYIGIKRILKCHPVKFLGGGSGFDPAPDLKKGKK